MVIYFHYVLWGWINGFGCGEGIGFVCGWAFVSGGVRSGSFHCVGVRVCRVWGKVAGRDKLFPRGLHGGI